MGIGAQQHLSQREAFGLTCVYHPVAPKCAHDGLGFGSVFLLPFSDFPVPWNWVQLKRQHGFLTLPRSDSSVDSSRPCDVRPCSVGRDSAVRTNSQTFASRRSTRYSAGDRKSTRLNSSHT